MSCSLVFCVPGIYHGLLRLYIHRTWILRADSCWYTLTHTTIRLFNRVLLFLLYPHRRYNIPYLDLLVTSFRPIPKRKISQNPGYHLVQHFSIRPVLFEAGRKRVNLNVRTLIIMESFHNYKFRGGVISTEIEYHKFSVDIMVESFHNYARTVKLLGKMDYGNFPNYKRPFCICIGLYYIRILFK